VFNPPLTTDPVPDESYVCSRNGTAYTVSRYVAWGDAAQTAKRLAVVIDWTDSAGRHEVSQQSSLRAPDAAAIIGAAPPKFSAAFPPTANPSTAWLDPTSGHIVTSNGSDSSLLLNATTTGLSATDQVFANILVVNPDGTFGFKEYTLTSTDGSNWQGTVPGGSSPDAPKLAPGSQYVSYTLVRATDGKANSTFSTPANKFCGNGTSGNTGGACAISATVPTVSGTASPSTIPLDPAGTMQAGSSLTITATTSNLVTTDVVTVTFQTLSGAATEVMLPSSSCPAGGTCNSWSKTIQPSVGYRFPPGNQYLYFGAAQLAGSTAAAQSAFAVGFAGS
jgi:hypothetical protein